MDENAEVKAENAKLRCALEEHEARFTKLEQRDKEKTNLITKINDDIKEIKQSLANASSVENPNNIVRLGKLEKMANPLNTSDSTFNSNVCKPIHTETKSLEDKETDDFLDEVYKKRVSDEIRQRNKEKKIQRESTVPSDLSCVTETSLRNHKDKTARSQIYNEMKPYLSGISDEYLCKITSKARKINKLFGYNYDSITLKKIKGIGWHMINRIIY